MSSTDLRVPVLRMQVNVGTKPSKRKPTEKTHVSEDWKPWKQEILDLYLKENKSPATILILLRNQGFIASLPQLKWKLHEWGAVLFKEDRLYIRDMIRRRNKKTAFRMKKERDVVDQRIIDKALRKNERVDDGAEMSSQSPALSVFTPATTISSCAATPAPPLSPQEESSGNGMLIPKTPQALSPCSEMFPSFINYSPYNTANPAIGLNQPPDTNRIEDVTMSDAEDSDIEEIARIDDPRGFWMNKNGLEEEIVPIEDEETEILYKISIEAYSAGFSSASMWSILAYPEYNFLYTITDLGRPNAEMTIKRTLDRIKILTASRLFDPAEAIAEALLHTCRSRLGNGCYYTREAKYRLADVFHNLDRYSQSSYLLEQMAEGSCQSFSERLLLAESMDLLSTSYKLLCQYRKAEKAGLNAVTTYKTLYNEGMCPEDSLHEAIMRLASIYFHDDKLNDAIQTILPSLLTNNHKTISEYEDDTTRYYMRIFLRNCFEALPPGNEYEAQMEELLIQLREDGYRHDSYNGYLINTLCLGRLYNGQRRYREQLEIYKDCIRLSDENFEEGDGDRITFIEVLSEMAELYNIMEMRKKSKQLWTRVKKCNKKIIKSKLSSTDTKLESLKSIGWQYMQEGNYLKAEHAYKMILKRRIALRGDRQGKALIVIHGLSDACYWVVREWIENYSRRTDLSVNPQLSELSTFSRAKTSTKRMIYAKHPLRNDITKRHASRLQHRTKWRKVRVKRRHHLSEANLQRLTMIKYRQMSLDEIKDHWISVVSPL